MTRNVHWVSPSGTRNWMLHRSNRLVPASSRDLEEPAMDNVLSFQPAEVGYCIEDLAVGMSAAYARTVTEADVILFAGISGDNNPVHMNELYAAQTRFGGRIVHGLLSASFVSTAIASKLPGPGSIYLSQNLAF